MPSRTAFAPGHLPISRSSFGLLVPNKCSGPLKIVGGWHSQLDARNPLNSLTVLLDPFDNYYSSSTLSIEWRLVLHNVFDGLPDSQSCLPNVLSSVEREPPPNRRLPLMANRQA